MSHTGAARKLELHVWRVIRDRRMIFFTDADVVFEPTALRRTVNYAIDNGRDHLAIAARIEMPRSELKANRL